MKYLPKRLFFLLLLMGAIVFAVTGCDTTWTVGSVIWAICVFFFWMIYIWIFITVFSDIFRRNDMSGGSKALWILLVIFLPLIGLLAYMITRPRMTAQDKQMMEEMEERQKRMAGHSATEEIAKAQALKDSGAITEAEFQELKRKAML